MNNWKDLVYNTLNQNSFLLINKQLLIELKAIPTLYLSYLIDKSKILQENESDWFYLTQEKIQEESTIPIHSQKKSVLKLKNFNLLETIQRGIPKRQWFKLNFENIGKLLTKSRFKVQRTVPVKSTDSTRDFASLNNKNLNIKTNNTFIKTHKSIKATSTKLPKNIFIKFWNEQEIRKHRPNTKTWRNSIKLLKELQNGTFHSKKVFSQEFLEKNKIPKKWLTKKWKEKEIKNGIKRYSKLFIEGYWPKNKSTLPKNLPDFLYNSQNQTSWFFLVLVNRPHLLESKPNINPIIAGILKTKCFPNEDIPKQIYYHIKNLEKWFNSIDRDFKSSKESSNKIIRNKSRLNLEWPNFEKFIKCYCKFLTEQKDFDFFPHQIFIPSSAPFQEFIKEYEKDLFCFKLKFKTKKQKYAA